MIRLTVEETNLLSIYNEGGKRALIENVNAALPYMDADMRELAKRTLSKVDALTEAEFAELPIYAADESTPLCAGRAAIMITGTVSYWTTGTSAYVRSSFPIRFSASGSGLRCFPPTGCFMRSFTRQGIRRNVPSAARSLRQPLTVSNTAPSAGNVSPADKPPSA